MTVVFWQWVIVLIFGAGLFVLSPRAKSVSQFFAATIRQRQPGFWMLTSSLVISWIFAKSITNAANLGMSYGMVGGVAYACYYLSFLVAGVVIYRLRTVGGFRSIHHFLKNRYGKTAMLIFSLLISIRLFNEVWSNTMIIGSYFGKTGSLTYYISILTFTALTLAYTIKGGLRSSLFTDAIQMALFGVILFVILGVLIPDAKGGALGIYTSGEWSAAGGLNLMWVALLQIFSYPFHDPVLTDRGFISSPKVTGHSFIWATFIGFTCIVLFSIVGIYAQQQALEGDQAPVLVYRTFGVGMMLLMNTIMITSASSTLDSTFSSFSKLVIVDWNLKASISKGRWAMVVLVIIGTIPVFWDPTILSATTISGTMVIGLAPVFLFWKVKAPLLSFILPVVFGIFCGIALVADIIPEDLKFFKGPYGDLLSINAVGSVICVGLYFIPLLFRKK